MAPPEPTPMVAKPKSRVSVPPEFKGLESAERWFARYDICCRANGWDEATKLAQVLPLMAGEALDFLLELTEGELKEYQTIRERMIREFDNSELREHYILQFKSRRLKDGEDYKSLMRDLRVLASKAYGDFDEGPRRLLIEDRFKEEMPEKVSGMLPFLNLPWGDLERLVDECRRLSKLGVNPPQRVSVVGGASAGVTNEAIMAKLVDMESRMHQMRMDHGDLEVQVNSLSATQSRGSTGAGGKGGNQQGGSRDNVVCYGCRQRGHFKRDCPQRKGGQGSQSTGRPQFHPGVVCSKCRNPGHYAGDCALNQTGSGNW